MICCAFQARFPGVTSPSRPGRGGRGGTDKEARQAERGPRGEAGGVGVGAGAVPGKEADSGPGPSRGVWPMERRGPGRRARLPAFKPGPARCPALGAPYADRAGPSRVQRAPSSRASAADPARSPGGSGRGGTQRPVPTAQADEDPPP